MSEGHINWYDSGFNNTKFCAILGDASRKILVAGEFQREDTYNSILLVDQMVERYGDILPMRELIMDNGSQFGAHRRGDNKEGVG